MTVTMLVLSVGLLAQAGDSPLSAPPRFSPRRAPAAVIQDEPTETRPRYGRSTTAEEPASNSRIRTLNPRHEEDDAGLVPVGGVYQKMRPPEIMADALSKVPEGAFAPEAGQPSKYQLLRLVDAIKASRDRAQQIKIAQVYWRLAIAQADYHFADDGINRLREATRNQLNNPALRAARCAARAVKRDTETLVIRAQNDLAAQMSLPPGSPMPLAIDKPHVGEYQTRFEQVYAGRTPPARAFLVNRTLPVRRSAIDEHAEGIIAAMDAVDTTTEEYAKGQTDLTTLIVGFERLWRERKGFSGAVREYNQDIAEYALSAAPSNSSDAALVSMLIKADTRAKSAPAESAPPPRRPATRLSDPDDQTSTGDRDRRNTTKAASSGPRDETMEVPTVPRARPKFGDTARSSTTTNFRRNIIFEEEAAQRALYKALIDIDTPLRTQRLASSLNAEEALPNKFGKSISLADCLNRNASARREILAAFWKTREAAAKYQAISDESTELAGLSPAAARIGAMRGGPEAVVRLQAVRKSAKAALTDTELELLLAQFELTSLCNAPLDGEWLLPITPPHGGRYSLRLDEQPASVIRDLSLDQLGSLVKVLHEQMEDHAGTVVYADAARAMALKDPGAGPAALDTATVLIDRQAAHTLMFLKATTRYNLAIADYVLAIMPENVSAQKLVSALVVTRSSTLGS